MALLAYCVIEAQPPIAIPQAGVREISIESVLETGLTCLVSSFDPADLPGMTPVRDAALEYHRVLQQVLAQVTLIPFRFPTVFRDEGEARQHLRQHEAGYHNDLCRLRGLVQMEIVLNLPSEVQPDTDPRSGTEYMRLRKREYDRLKQVENDLLSALQSGTRGWRRRDTSTGFRTYALVERAQVEDFVRQARALKLPLGYAVRVTGPWPPAEFLSQK